MRLLLRTVLAWFGRRFFSLRYRIDVRGLDEVRARGTRGVLFLPSHLALIDPVIMTVLLEPGFHPRALADEYQLKQPVIGPLARLFGARPLPNMERVGVAGVEGTREALAATLGGLRAGENLLFYPGGRLRRQRLEEIRATSGTEALVKGAPDARVVLVRQTGLWGSSFSVAFTGHLPSAAKMALQGLKFLFLNGVLFMPRRHLLVEFTEPTDFPRDQPRMAINGYLEAFYNERAPGNTYVPYARWERGGTREVPDPAIERIAGEASDAPNATRELVMAELRRMSGLPAIALDSRLAQDLGLDSLTTAELAVWVEKEFGFSVGTPESLVTAGDVVLAAAGKAVSAIQTDLKRPGAAWGAAGDDRRPLSIPAGTTITEVFLAQAACGPDRIVLADQTSGELSYRRLVLGLLLMVPTIRDLPGRYVGIMLPASAGAALFYLAALFAGKTPVMINWTTGARNLVHALDLLGVERVITAKALLSKLASLGTDLSTLSDRFLLAEDLRGRFSTAQKLSALVRSRFTWRALRRATPPAQAVVLFTSGSESVPKAVPLTHANLLTNVRDILAIVDLEGRDVLIGMLPPFHSFGITATTVLPLCSALRAVYHPNPTEAAVLAKVIETYGVTALVGTPTFLHGIVRSATPAQLASLRFAVTGAEKCPDTVYQALREQCPGAVILEGYGITECSPVVSVNRPGATVAGSIGPLLRSVEGAIVHLETGARVPSGQPGMLLVRGPTIFDGYLNYAGESPFVDFEGHRWYRTGDLVRQDATGVLWFEGRLKRFVKLGGEMISLPAIEAVLLPHFAANENEGPPLAVDALGTAESPEIVLFSTRPTDRERVNQWLRAGGLSPLHNVRQVILVEAIPVLGTGKTDYRGLRARLALDLHS